MTNDSSGDAAGAISDGTAIPEKLAARWLVPIASTLILSLLFCLYYFVYVGSRREYLVNRNFRMLASLGDQIQSMITTYGSILEFYADVAGKNRHPAHGRKKVNVESFLLPRKEDVKLGKKERQDEEQKDYLNYLAPNFELSTPKRIPTADPASGDSSKARLHVERRDSQWLLVLTAAPEKGDETDFKGSLRLSQMLKPLIGSLPFDDILLASDDGTIVYQDKRTGPQFTALESLLAGQTGAADKKTAGESSKPFQTSSVSMHLTDVLLTGTHYKLFLQPVLVDVFTDDPNQRKPLPQHWVLCGLRSASALEWEALAISYSVIIWVTAGFFAVLMGGPILRLFFMNRRERFRLRDLALLGLFLVLLSCVLTLSGLQWAYFDRNGSETERRLQQVAGVLSQNIHRELRHMRDQLVSFCMSSQLRVDLERADAKGTDVIRKRPPEPPIDRSIHTPDATDYPYFANAFWTDDDGRQIVKWSGGEFVTPMIDLSRSAIYQHPKATYLDGSGPPFHFDSILPPNRLEYMAAMTMTTCDCNPNLCASRKIGGIVHGGSAFLVAQPFSLIDPVLPFGYGFALVDESGSVLFHSDKTRNLHENFQQESDWNKELYAAAFGHGTQHSVRINYRGQAYRAVVVPVANASQAPWMLIVYRDLTSVRTLDLQAITMASTLMILFLIGPVLIVAVWCWVRRPRFAPEWIWPNAARITTYQYQIGLYTVLIVLFLLLGFRASSEQSVIACAALPYAALLVTIWCFRSAAAAGSDGNRGKFVFVLTAVLLAAIVLVGVLALRRTNARELALMAVSGGIAAMTLLDRPRKYFVRRFRYRYVEVAAPASIPSTHGALDYRVFHATSALLLLLLVGVLMPLALFRASLSVERRLRIKQAQLHLAASLNQRQMHVEAQLKAGDNGNDALSDFYRKDRKDRKDRRWLQSGLVPVFIRDGVPAMEPYKPMQGTELYDGWFRRLVYLLHHDYNQASAEMLGVISNRDNAGVHGGDSDWTWVDEPRTITLRWHGAHPPPGEAADQEQDLTIQSKVWQFSSRDTGFAVGVSTAVLLVMGGLFWLVARRLFLVDVAEMRITGQRRLAEALREGRNVLVLRPRVSDWQLEEPKWTLELAPMATEPGWAERMDMNRLPVNTLIEIPDFEHITDDPEVGNQKRILLRRLIQREKTQVAAVMTVDASAEDYRRKFPELEVIDLREEPFLWLAACEGPARDLIWKEVSPLPALWPMGAQLAKDIRSDDLVSPEAITSEILERADAYYQLVWDECSKDQKFALVQLSEDGLVNPENGRSVRQMLRRGLIVKDPQFRIMNESFRRFLCSAVAHDLRLGWLRESRGSGWGRAQGAFATSMVLVGIFLLTTQNELWQSSAAYVTTALGALGTLSKLLTAVRGGGGPTQTAG